MYKSADIVAAVPRTCLTLKSGAPEIFLKQKYVTISEIRYFNPPIAPSEYNVSGTMG